MYARSCLSTASWKFWNYQEKQRKNAIMVLILGGPEQSQELHSAIPVDPFQRGTFHG